MGWVVRSVKYLYVRSLIYLFQIVSVTIDEFYLTI